MIRNPSNIMREFISKERARELAESNVNKAYEEIMYILQQHNCTLDYDMISFGYIQLESCVTATDGTQHYAILDLVEEEQ